MRSAFLLSLLFACALFACENAPAAKEKSTAPVIDSTDEYAVMSLVLDAEAGPDSIHRRHRIAPLFPDEKDPKKIEQYRRFSDSIRQVYDTAQLVLYVKPATVSYESKNIKALLVPQLFAANFTGVDSAFIPLLQQMADSVRNATVNPSRLHTTYDYSLVTAPLDYWKRRGQLHIAGAIGLSPVYFDSEKQRACVYATYWCGELCGDGTIYFLEKKNGKWIIAGNRCMWVS